MPAKNSIKTYVDNGFYHVYNRGVNKRKIFKGVQDYKVFLSYLKEYLSPPPSRDSQKTIFTLKGLSFKGVPRAVNNYHNEIELIAYCLMPNHFHLLIKQSKSSSMTGFTKSLLTRYSMYFNKKYSRTGHLFQSSYKAAMINNEEYLLWLSRYIHRNPCENYKNLANAYSSYGDYLKLRRTAWIHPEIVLGYFNQNYQAFVEDEKKDVEFVLADNFILEN